jgi:hypothetical protein
MVDEKSTRNPILILDAGYFVATQNSIGKQTGPLPYGQLWRAGIADARWTPYVSEKLMKKFSHSILHAP